MAKFSPLSHFSQEQDTPKPKADLFPALPHNLRSVANSDRFAGVERQEIERWYNETNDLVRMLGVSTSTQMPRKDAQKRSQKASSGSASGYGSTNIREIHERLTELRDQIYRYVR